MSFFRYPGGKAKLRKQILAYILPHLNKDLEYREPFFGGGTIGLSLLDKINKIWINDKDVGVASLWTAVIKYPDELKQLVLDFKPSVDEFYRIKQELLMPQKSRDIVELGFMKLVIHQLSYSGLGVKSGGPLGGQKQSSAYKIDCRWSPQYICKKIDRIHKQFCNVDIRHGVCTNLDFADVIIDNTNTSLLYLDPPYYGQGNNLYQFGFSDTDHARLSRYLCETQHKWLLSYDKCDEISRLYEWACCEELVVNYTITTSTHKSEFIIHK